MMMDEKNDERESLASASLTKTVGANDTASAFGSSFPEAAATPWVLGLAEVACHMAVEPTLSAGEITVGTAATIYHEAPTPVGADVTAKATLVKQTGRRLTFEVSVHDGIEVCARIMHDRAIVRAADIAKRLAAKQAHLTEGS